MQAWWNGQIDVRWVVVFMFVVSMCVYMLQHSPTWEVCVEPGKWAFIPHEVFLGLGGLGQLDWTGLGWTGLEGWVEFLVE